MAILKTFLLLMLALSLSQCSAIKRNGYYQSKKYNLKHVQVFNKKRSNVVKHHIYREEKHEDFTIDSRDVSFNKYVLPKLPHNSFQLIQIRIKPVSEPWAKTASVEQQTSSKLASVSNLNKDTPTALYGVLAFISAVVFIVLFVLGIFLFGNLMLLVSAAFAILSITLSVLNIALIRAFPEDYRGFELSIIGLILMAICLLFMYLSVGRFF